MTALPCNFVQVSADRVKCTTCGALFHTGTSDRACQHRPSQRTAAPSTHAMRPFERGMMRKSDDPSDR